MPVRPAAAIAALTALALAVRLATIDVQSYWFDEALTAWLLRMPLADMVSDIARTELTPPLYYVVAWPWAQLLGTGEVALRSLSALFGTATVPVAYLAARALASERAGVAAAALVAFNPLLIWYSQETRPYALFVLLGALSFLLFLRAREAQRPGRLALWALASALLVLTHYFGAFLVAPEALWLIAAARRRAPAVLAAAAVGAVGLALVPLAREQREWISTEYISSFSLARRFLGVPEDFLTGFVIAANSTIEIVLAALAVPAAALGLWLAARRAGRAERRGALAALVVGGTAAAVPLVLALGGLDFLNTRNVLAALVPLLLVPAIGFAARGAGRAGVAGTAVLCAVGVAATAAMAADNRFHRDDWRGVAAALGRPQVDRALAVPPVSGDISLSLYQDGLRPLPPQGAAVREVAYVAVRNKLSADGPGGGGGADAPPPPPPAAGLRLVERRREETFTVLRYRSERPVRLRAGPGTVRGLGGPASMLLQRAPAPTAAAAGGP